MSALELKVPPPVVFLVCLGLLYAGDLVLPFASVALPFNTPIALIIVFIGGLLGAQAVLAFLKAKTTVHPMHPEEASALVTSGFYRISRNPMYLGLLLFLLAAGIYWGTLTLIAVGPLFIWYMTEFQIKPEETRLADKFGEDYLDYLTKVRRWI